MVTKPNKVRKVQYLGAKAEVWTVKTGGANSERVQYIHWLDKAVGQPVEHPAGTVEALTMVGTGHDTAVVAKSITTLEG